MSHLNTRAILREELRRFQLHLVDKGISRITLNATITAPRFFFQTTLGWDDVMLKMSTVPVPRKSPTVLSCQEITRLIDATRNPKYQAELSIKS